MSALAREEAKMVAARDGTNEPLEFHTARWDKWRSVRIKFGGRDIGLATATYSYQLTQDERSKTARRIAALWNLAAEKGWSTDFIESALSPPPSSGESA